MEKACWVVQTEMIFKIAKKKMEIFDSILHKSSSVKVFLPMLSCELNGR